MAKLKAPLLSLGASGQIAKSLVFFGWKGLDCAREYVKPSNPNTASQSTQRGYFTAAVAAIHAALALASHPLDEDDKSALSALGSTRATPRTWFNEQVKEWSDVKVAGNVPIVYSDGTVSDTTANSIDLIAYINEETPSTLAAGKFYFGSSKTSLIHSKAATVTPGATVALTAEDCSAFLTAGQKYYFQFRPDVADGCEGAVSGIYSFTAS